MEFRKMITITLYARQQKRHRYIEQSYGLCGSGRGWDDLGEWHWNMYNIICEMNRNSRFDAWYRMLGAGALGWPRGMGWGGRWEGDSGWGTCVHPWRIHVDVWQNQYNIVKKKKKKKNWTWDNRLVPNKKQEYIKAIYCHPAYLTYMQSTVLKCSSWVQSQNWQIDPCLFPRQTIQYHTELIYIYIYIYIYIAYIWYCYHYVFSYPSIQNYYPSFSYFVLYSHNLPICGFAGICIEDICETNIYFILFIFSPSYFI